MTQVLLGVDIGTGSTKAVLTDTVGNILAQARADHSMSLPRPGWAEMDAEKDWWGDFTAVVKEILDKKAALSGAANLKLAGLCVSGLGPCLLATDAKLQPLRPAMLYGIDMRATAEISALTERLGAEEILAVCGKELSTQAIGPKLAWLAANEPAFRPENPWFSAHNYVAARLTGRWVIDHHTASQCDPLYNVTTQDWHRDWVDAVVPSLALPELVWPMEVIGEVLPKAAAQTGLPIGLPVIAGTVDAWAEAFSVGVRHPGDLMLMYGSTMFMIQVLPAPNSAPGLWTTSGVEAGSHTLAAGMATSGSLTQWIGQLTGETDFARLVAEAAAVPPGADGLVLLPYFAGERAPIFDPDARGVVAGLSLRHGRGHIFRAAYEGIAYGIRQITELLGEVAGPPARVVAVGGGTQGGLWTQIVSDVCGIAQYVPATTVGAAYGDALLAAIGIGAVPPETDWATIAATVQPNPAVAGVYEQIYQVFGQMYLNTREEVHVLSAIQKG